jgi:hypothetical protein
MPEGNIKIDLSGFKLVHLKNFRDRGGNNLANDDDVEMDQPLIIETSGFKKASTNIQAFSKKEAHTTSSDHSEDNVATSPKVKRVQTLEPLSPIIPMVTNLS